MSHLTTMTDKVEQYLAHRRSLGFKLGKAEWHLRKFAAFVDSLNYAGPLTVELAVQWACLPSNGAPSFRIHRLTAVRSFARYLAVSEPGTEIPPTGLLGTVRRPQHHIYSQEEILALIAVALQLKPGWPR